MAWYNESWLYRKKITVDNTKVSADETDFPMLVSLATDDDLAADAQDDGDDILFTKSDGTTKLDHEIELFNGTTGQLIAWVETDLSSSVDTDIYMYYGNAGATNQENPTGVYDSNYKLVWHMDDPDTGTAVDDSTTLHDGTKDGNALPSQGTSKIGLGQDFNNTSAAITVADHVDLRPTGDWTCSAWVEIASGISGGTWKLIYGKAGTQAWGLNWNVSDNKLYVWFYTTDWYSAVTTATYTPTDGTYYYMVTVWDDTDQKMYLYINGAVAASNDINADLIQGTGVFNVGKESTSRWWMGFIDELRFSNIIRSANWILTEYNNQNSPSTFYALGSEESGGDSIMGGCPMGD